MKLISGGSEDYLTTIAKRKTDSKVYTEHQLMGLEVAKILSDEAHKGLYIKLTKKFGKDKILGLAKQVADNKNVKKKGAYFMRMLYSENKNRI